MFQPDETSNLPTRLSNTATSTYLLQHLNNDCLYEIFSLKSLDPVDLCSLAETCRRFQQISQRIFPKELNIYIFDDRVCFESGNLMGNFQPWCSVERILKHFGPILEGISFSMLSGSRPMMRSNVMLNFVATYCVGTLKRLTLDDMNISEMLAVKLQSIFKRLELLDIQYGSVDSGIVFTGCDSLIDLRVCNVKNSKMILENTFPRLQRLSYSEYLLEINEHFYNFILRHNALIKLHVNTTTDERFLHALIDHCKGLTKLAIGKVGIRKLDASSLQSLQELESLESLSIRSCEDFRFVSTLTHLRELHLYNCTLPTDHNQLVDQFEHIIKLRIFQTFKPCSLDTVVTIIRVLKNLEELSVGDGPWKRFLLDEITFSEIVGIVKGRPHVLLLRCKFNFVVKKSDENRRVQLLSLGYQLFSELFSERSVL